MTENFEVTYSDRLAHYNTSVQDLLGVPESPMNAVLFSNAAFMQLDYLVDKVRQLGDEWAEYERVGQKPKMREAMIALQETHIRATNVYKIALEAARAALTTVTPADIID